MTRILLHIGQHKTGSTALQYSLAGNRARLQEYGVLYPRLQGWKFAHHALFPHFFGVDRCDPFILRRMGASSQAAVAASREAWANLVSEVSRSPPRCLLLSSEAFFTTPDPGRIAALGAMLREIADNIEVVCYLRHPADFVLSSLSTQVQMDAFFLWPDPGVRRAVIEAYEAIEPTRIHVMKYDRTELLGGDIVRDFTHRFIGENVTLASAGRVNNSFSPEAIAVMQKFVTDNNSSRDRPMPYRQQLFRRILKYVDRATPGFSNPQLLPESRDSIMKGCTDLDWLERVYGIQWAGTPGAASSHSEAIHYGDKLSPLGNCKINPRRLERLNMVMSLVSGITRPMDSSQWRRQ